MSEMRPERPERGTGPPAGRGSGDAPGSHAPASARRRRTRPSPGDAPLADGAEQVLELVAPPPAALPVAGAWRRLFDGVGSRELLARLVADDPLGLWPRCAAELERRRHVVHPDRLLLAALTRVALLAPGYRGRPAIEAWLEERVAESLRAVLAEDASAEIERRPVAPDELWQHAMMVEVFGVEPPLARRAAVRFNAQAVERRRVLFALAFEGRSIDDVVAAGLGARHEVRDHLTAGLATLSRLEPPTLKDLLALEGEV